MNKKILLTISLLLSSEFCNGKKQVKMNDFLRFFCDVSLTSFNESALLDLESYRHRSAVTRMMGGHKPFLKLGCLPIFTWNFPKSYFQPINTLNGIFFPLRLDFRVFRNTMCKQSQGSMFEEVGPENCKLALAQRI